MVNNTCQNCHHSCATCSNTLSSGCLTCTSDRSLGGGGFCIKCSMYDFYTENDTCDDQCSQDRIPDTLSRICCNNCLTCDGPSQSECLTCPPRRRLQGSTCEPCGGFCDTCSGPNQNQCISCFQAAEPSQTTEGECVCNLPNINANGVCSAPSLICHSSCSSCNGKT